jgi:hypothetical protein
MALTFSGAVADPKRTERDRQGSKCHGFFYKLLISTFALGLKAWPDKAESLFHDGLYNFEY